MKITSIVSKAFVSSASMAVACGSFGILRSYQKISREKKEICDGIL